MTSYILKVEQGFDSKAGKDYHILHKNTSLQNVIQFCINHNCHGFVKVGKGQYYIRPPQFSASHLELSKKYKKYKYKNIALYTLRY